MLIIQTGVRYNQRFEDTPIRSLIIDEHPDEFDPELVFHACNRIESPMEDIEVIAAAWPGQQWLLDLRAGIDANEMPSMSGGDVIHVFTHESGYQLGYWDCQPIGWEFIRTLGSVNVADVINSTKVHHIIKEQT